MDRKALLELAYLALDDDAAAPQLQQANDGQRRRWQRRPRCDTAALQLQPKNEEQ